MVSSPAIVPALQASVNGRVLDRAIRHAIGIRRLGAKHSADVLEFLDEKVYPDLLATVTARLAKNPGRGITFDFTSRRHAAMVTAIRKILDEGFAKAEKITTKNLEGYAQHEADYTTGSMAKAMPIQWEFLTPPASVLNAIVHAQPVVDGVAVPEVFRRLSESVKRRVEDAIRSGMIQGETTASIVRRLTSGTNPILDQSRRGVEAMVRTATNAVGTATRQATYKENDDIVKGWQFVATLDDSTTRTCAKLDGKVFKIGEGPMPPRHPGCRSDDAPVLKSFRELGIPINDLEVEERASMNGRVQGKITFQEWLRQQPEEFQDEYLGKGAADIFRRGNVSFDRFADDHGKNTSLVELQRMERDVLRRKGKPRPTKPQRPKKERAATFTGGKVDRAGSGKVITSQKALERMIRDTDTHVDSAALRKAIFADGAEFYQEQTVDLADIKVSGIHHDPETLDPTRAILSKGAILIDARGEVIDGRHRVLAARARGDKTIQAFRPINGPNRKARSRTVEAAPPLLTGRQLRRSIVSDPEVQSLRAAHTQAVKEQESAMAAMLSQLQESRAADVSLAKARKEIGDYVNSGASRAAPEFAALRAAQASALERSQKASARRPGLVKQVTDTQGNAKRQEIAVQAAIRKRLKVPASRSVPISLKARKNHGLSPEDLANAEDAAGFLSGITSNPQLRGMEIPIGVAKDGRSFMATPEVAKAFRVEVGIHMRPGSSVDVFAHEMGHWMEHHDPKLYRRSERLLEKRLQGDPRGIRKMSEITSSNGYGDDEVAVEDDFLSPYMGKLYPKRQQASEITSMGVEWLYKDPVSLMDKDAEMFDWIVDGLRGT